MHQQFVCYLLIVHVASHQGCWVFYHTYQTRSFESADLCSLVALPWFPNDDSCSWFWRCCLRTMTRLINYDNLVRLDLAKLLTLASLPRDDCEYYHRVFFAFLHVFQLNHDMDMPQCTYACKSISVFLEASTRCRIQWVVRDDTTKNDRCHPIRAALWP